MQEKMNNNSTAQIRVDTGGADFVPHTFLVITQPDGIQFEYGLVPKEHLALSGPGHIDITGKGFGKNPHERNPQYDGPIVPLTHSQYDAFKKIIEREKSNPPYYNVLGAGNGINCTQWGRPYVARSRLAGRVFSMTKK